MRRWVSLGLILLVVTGCGDRRPSAGPAVAEGGSDSGGDLDAAAPAEASTPDAAPFDRGAPDGSVAGTVLCASEAPAGAVPSCEVQDPGAVAACAGAGAVVFDGVTCRSAMASECSAPLGAFATFEECAWACSHAGHCDGTKLANWVASCDRIWLHPAAGYEVPEAKCHSEGWICEEPAPEPDYGSPGNRCWTDYVGAITPERTRQMCALTLLPSIHRLMCFNYL